MKDIFFRRQNGQLINVSMAVVIQEMVDANSAGVIFSRSPINGDPSKITITANFGLGESVVSALSDPDSITVENIFWKQIPELKIIEKKCGSKSKKIVMTDTDTKEIELDAESSKLVSISDEIILDLARLAINLEEMFGNPRDIEFAIWKVIKILHKNHLCKW